MGLRARNVVKIEEKMRAGGTARAHRSALLLPTSQMINQRAWCWQQSMASIARRSLLSSGMGAGTVIYTVYFKFVKEVLDAETSEEDEIAEIMNDVDLDFL